MTFQLPQAYSPEQIVREPQFIDGLNAAAHELIATFRLMPRRVRYVADAQRWMLSHGAFALHFEHKADPSQPAATAQNLALLLEQCRAVSKNTITAFLLEMRRYRFAEAIETSDRRRRAVRATEETEQLVRHYVDIHLRALDAMDDGARFVASRPLADFTAAAQPRFARRLLGQADWTRPSPNLAHFVKSDSGSNILHLLHARAPRDARLDEAPIWIGPVSPREIARDTLISPSHAVRIFARAREAGLLGWAQQSNRGDCWISPALLRDYRHWQALKLSAMSYAAREAFEHLRP